jgi:hypothetical protein
MSIFPLEMPFLFDAKIEIILYAAPLAAAFDNTVTGVVVNPTLVVTPVILVIPRRFGLAMVSFLDYL